MQTVFVLCEIDEMAFNQFKIINVFSTNKLANDEKQKLENALTDDDEIEYYIEEKAVI